MPREFRLEPKRGGSVPKFRQVEFIALPFLFSSTLKIWSFQIVVVQGRQSFLVVQKSMMLGRVVVLLIKPVAFFDIPFAIVVIVS